VGNRIDLSFNAKTEISGYVHQFHRVPIGIGTRFRPAYRLMECVVPNFHMTEEVKGHSNAPLCMNAMVGIVHSR